MKRILSIFALIGLVAFQACEGPEGPIGPAGPQGEVGEPGVNIVSEVFEVETDFTKANNYEAVFDFDRLVRVSKQICKKPLSVSVLRTLPAIRFTNGHK